MADLKPVYKAPTIDAAEGALNMLAAKWENLSTFFKYPEPIRRLRRLNKRSALYNLQVGAEF